MLYSPPYGEFWREIRKICVLNVLSQKQVSTFSPIRRSELKNMMIKISRNASSSKLTNFTEAMMSLTSTVICRILFGRSYEDDAAEGSRFYSLLKGCQEMMVAFFFSDFIPSLGWIDTVTGKKARLRTIFKEVDEFFQDAIDEHSDPKRKVNPENQDVTDIILKLQKQGSSSIEMTDDVVKAILMVWISFFFSISCHLLFSISLTNSIHFSCLSSGLASSINRFKFSLIGVEYDGTTEESKSDEESARGNKECGRKKGISRRR